MRTPVWTSTAVPRARAAPAQSNPRRNVHQFAEGRSTIVPLQVLMKMAPLAAGGVPVWVVSSYDGDLVLVPTDRLDEASEVLQAAGHQVLR